MKFDDHCCVFFAIHTVLCERGETKKRKQNSTKLKNNQNIRKVFDYTGSIIDLNNVSRSQ